MWTWYESQRAEHEKEGTTGQDGLESVYRINILMNELIILSIDNIERVS